MPKRIKHPTVRRESLEEQWAIQLRAGTIATSIPPIPDTLQRYPLTPGLDELSDLLAMRLREPWQYPGNFHHPHGRPFPYTLAIHHASGPVVGVVVHQTLNRTWGTGRYAVAAWDHLGGVWAGCLTEDPMGGAHTVRLRRRTTGKMRLPCWFGPAHLCPDGFRAQQHPKQDI